MVMKKAIWSIVSCLMILALVITSCDTSDTSGTVTEEDKGQTVSIGDEEEKTTDTGKEDVQPVTEEPQYGGSLTLFLGGEPTDWLPWAIFNSPPVLDCHEWVWNGDWARGYAGGYGTGEVGWEQSTNIRGLKDNYLAEDISWEISEDGTKGYMYITIRDGVHFGLDPDNPHSAMVGGREVTIDDIIWNYDIRMNDTRYHPGLFLNTGFPWTNGIYGEKTGPNTCKYTCEVKNLLDLIMLCGDGAPIFPSELGDVDSTVDWQSCVGAGAFMIKDYIPDNMISVKRNPNFWDKDPVGPGMGNQLPYIDSIKYLVIPDNSTQLAAFRTGQLDQRPGYSIEERADMVRQQPDVKEAEGAYLSAGQLGMRTDLSGTPYANVKVRRAMMMATDFNEINEGLYQGLGHILTWPYWQQKGYERLYLGLDDPDMPDTIKELYVYNPEKAKELLAEAGYPTGFKTEILVQTADIDYFAVIQQQWEKVGIEVEIVSHEFGTWWSMVMSVGYEHMVASFIPPASSWPEVAGYTGITASNFSRINDAYVNEATDHMRTTAITDLGAAMDETRELMKYLLEGAWVIPSPRYPTYILWWPWLKNYSGETAVGWLPHIWPRWVWVDQDLKTSMGY
jgi:peptide/nickel transport system substrate-binding protein